MALTAVWLSPWGRGLPSVGRIALLPSCPEKRSGTRGSQSPLFRDAPDVPASVPTRSPIILGLPE